MLWITNNSVKHQSFIYSRLNDQTVLFLTIQFCISHLFALCLNVKDRTLSGATTSGLSGPWSIGNERNTPHFPMLPHYWILTIGLFSVISRTLDGEEVLALCRDAVDVFYSPKRLGLFRLKSKWCIHTVVQT